MRSYIIRSDDVLEALTRNKVSILNLQGYGRSREYHAVVNEEHKAMAQLSNKLQVVVLK